MKGRCFVMAMLVSIASSAHASDIDWTYELPDSAKAIFESGKAPRRCELLNAETSPDDAYILIRDAGIFLDTTCENSISVLPAGLAHDVTVQLATNFYRLRLGDESQLTPLLTSFDRDARQIGDHWTVELFGFLPDWEHTGRRLARHSLYSDGAASALLHSALLWKRFLYDQDPEFRASCLRIVEEEGVSDWWLPRFCGPD